MARSIEQIRLSEQRGDQLALAMITFLKANGYDNDAAYAQELFDHDGSTYPIETGLEVIMDNHLDPAPALPLFNLLYEDDDLFREEYRDFHDYIARWRSDHQQRQ
ncbi:hypothetical protein JS530_06625 [Bifidobacterium sp. LC6]|uniref:Uncharacterized protein n=1 Tax=Bifidobacterium colobi TaxID=2809026 RepID=A0ABS5UWX1_9BIFI|nr:hypothetical protein [Bifidobacterium colobi]MBT1175172.1 hypothetical protein [Bifidobacterium colobi]